MMHIFGGPTGSKDRPNIFGVADGWNCALCRNYNFPDREICNRCKKARAESDVTGLPDHLLKKKAMGSVFKARSGSVNVSPNQKSLFHNPGFRNKKKVSDHEKYMKADSSGMGPSWHTPLGNHVK
jgi:hypothetical protein